MLVVFQTRPRTVRSIVVYIFTRHIDRHQRSQIVRRDMPAWIIIKDEIRQPSTICKPELFVIMYDYRISRNSVAGEK